MFDAVVGDRDMSLPTRGAWIEIVYVVSDAHADVVAPHTGSVD